MIAYVLSIVQDVLTGNTERFSNLCYILFFGCIAMLTVTEELDTNDELREKWALNAVLLASTASVSFDFAFGNLHWLLLLVKVMLFVPSIVLRPTPENSSFVVVFYLHWYESLLGVVELCRLLGTPETTTATTIVKPPIQPVVTPIQPVVISAVVAATGEVSPAPVLEVCDDAPTQVLEVCNGKARQDLFQVLPTSSSRAYSNNATTHQDLGTLKLWQIKDVIVDSTFDDDDETENLPHAPPTSNVHSSDLATDSSLATLKLWQIKDILYETTFDIDFDDVTEILPAHHDTQTISRTSVNPGIDTVSLPEEPSPAHHDVDRNDLVTDSDLFANQVPSETPTLPEVQLITKPHSCNSVNLQKRCPSRAPKADRPPAIPTRRSGRKVQVPDRFDPSPPSKTLTDVTKILPVPNHANHENHSNRDTCVTQDLLQGPSPVNPKGIRNVKHKKPQRHSSRAAGITATGKNLTRATKAPPGRPKPTFQSKRCIRPNLKPNRNVDPTPLPQSPFQVEIVRSRNRRHVHAPSRLTADVLGSWKQ